MDSPAMQDAHPPITAVELNAHKLGRMAVATLVDVLTGNRPPSDSLTIEHRLIPRASSSGPATG
jgi:DNA-binding LacI/PurR family transcriptional regulator